ncbi:hypothetical protein RR48_13667 [Papilio machaon]|uniref:Vitelline membrane protein Vm26Ab n=1 Tax=Papilio machaon TaxID=76193 RepID=A0A194RLF1_PAPMA|nr:hypothetical protein RR48_13667 [Papilio machaon]
MSNRKSPDMYKWVLFACFLALATEQVSALPVTPPDVETYNAPAYGSHAAPLKFSDYSAPAGTYSDQKYAQPYSNYFFIFACFLALAAAKPGVLPVAYTAPVAAAYTAPVAAAYTAPLAYSAYAAYTAPVAAYSAFPYAAPYSAYFLRR